MSVTPGSQEGPWPSVVLFPNEIEALGAVFTEIGNGRARFEWLVLRQEADQVCSATTLDTDDGLRGPVHNSLGGRAPLSMSTPVTPATNDPAKMPTLAKSVSWGSAKARLVTNNETVNPIPAIAARPNT